MTGRSDNTPGRFGSVTIRVRANRPGRMDAEPRAERGVLPPDAIERSYRRWLYRRLERAHELALDRLDNWLTGRRRAINRRARQDSLRWDGVKSDVESLARTIGSMKITWGEEHSGEAAEKRAEEFGWQTSAYNKAQQKRVFSEVAGLDPTFGDDAVRQRIKSFASDNVDLITGLDGVERQYFDQLEDELVRALREGVRHEKFADVVEDRLGVARSRARLIARDQIQKLNSRLTQSRQQELGVRRYRWKTAGDERVRPSHSAKNGEVFAWQNPPTDTGHPGEDINCRCVAIPLVEEVLKPGRPGVDTDSPSPEQLNTGDLAASASEIAAEVGAPQVKPDGTRDFGAFKLESDDKLRGQIPDRGWSTRTIRETVQAPARTKDVRDTRWLPDGTGRRDDPATAYVREDGSYVVVNDTNSHLVQVSDRTDIENWDDPWNEED